MMKPAHQSVLRKSTKKSKPQMVAVSKIAVAGYPLREYADVEKVQRMEKSLAKRGGKLKPVRLIKLTSELRDQYGVDDPSKEFYLLNGHHRFAAVKLSGRKMIRAVDYHEGRRI